MPQSVSFPTSSYTGTYNAKIAANVFNQWNTDVKNANAALAVGAPIAAPPPIPLGFTPSSNIPGVTAYKYVGGQYYGWGPGTNYQPQAMSSQGALYGGGSVPANATVIGNNVPMGAGGGGSIGTTPILNEISPFILPQPSYSPVTSGLILGNGSYTGYVGGGGVGAFHPGYINPLSNDVIGTNIQEFGEGGGYGIVSPVWGSPYSPLAYSSGISPSTVGSSFLYGAPPILFPELGGLPAATLNESATSEPTFANIPDYTSIEPTFASFPPIAIGGEFGDFTRSDLGGQADLAPPSPFQSMDFSGIAQQAYESWLSGPSIDQTFASWLPPPPEMPEFQIPPLDQTFANFLPQPIEPPANFPIPSIDQRISNWISGNTSPTQGYPNAEQVPFIEPAFIPQGPGIAVSPSDVQSAAPGTEATQIPGAEQLPFPTGFDYSGAPYADMGVTPATVPDVAAPPPNVFAEPGPFGADTLYQGGYGQPTPDYTLAPPKPFSKAEQFVTQVGDKTTIAQIAAKTGHPLDAQGEYWLGQAKDMPIDLSQPLAAQMQRNILNAPDAGRTKETVAEKAVAKYNETVAEQARAAGITPAQVQQAVMDAASDVQQDRAEGPGAYWPAFTTTPTMGGEALAPFMLPGPQPTQPGIGTNIPPRPPADIPTAEIPYNNAGAAPPAAYDLGAGFGPAAPPPSFSYSDLPYSFYTQPPSGYGGGSETQQPGGYPPTIEAGEPTFAQQPIPGLMDNLASTLGNLITPWQPPIQAPPDVFADMADQLGIGNINDYRNIRTVPWENMPKVGTLSQEDESGGFHYPPSELDLRNNPDLTDLASNTDWSKFNPQPSQNIDYAYPLGGYGGGSPTEQATNFVGIPNLPYGPWAVPAEPPNTLGESLGLSSISSVQASPMQNPSPMDTDTESLMDELLFPHTDWSAFNPTPSQNVEDVRPTPEPGPIQAGYRYIPGMFGEIDPYNFSSAPFPQGGYGGGGFPDQGLMFPDYGGFTPYEPNPVAADYNQFIDYIQNLGRSSDWSKFSSANFYDPSIVTQTEDMRSGYIPAAEPDSKDFRWDTAPLPGQGEQIAEPEGYDFGKQGYGGGALPGPYKGEYGGLYPAPLEPPGVGLPVPEEEAPGVSPQTVPTGPGQPPLPTTDPWATAYGDQGGVAATPPNVYSAISEAWPGSGPAPMSSTLDAEAYHDIAAQEALAPGKSFGSGPGQVNWKGVSESLQDIISQGKTLFEQLNPGYAVRAISGHREGATQAQHASATGAIDLAIYPIDSNGNITGPMVPYTGADTTGLYTQLAQINYSVMQDQYPELQQNFNWGGFFSSSGQHGLANPQTGALNPDLMHFDLGGQAYGGRAGITEAYGKLGAGDYANLGASSQAMTSGLTGLASTANPGDQLPFPTTQTAPNYYFGPSQSAPSAALTAPEAVNALNTVGANLGVSPSALAMVAMEESAGQTTNQTGSYKGLFQENLGGGLAPFTSPTLQQDAPTQIRNYQNWWNSYAITQQLQAIGLQDLSGFTVPQQAALIQAFQLAPNHAAEIVLNVLTGNYNIPATTSRQAPDLGNKSFGYMSGTTYLPRYVGGLGAWGGPPQ